MTIADRIIQYNRELNFPAKLPARQKVIHPFTGEGSELVLMASEKFYRKFYSDNQPRTLILGINPGRHGAGATGIPFTDTKRLASKCGITMDGQQTHEPSSVFVYEVIEELGGPEVFYRQFFVNSLCPLGFLRLNEGGNWVNYNFYDDKTLLQKSIPLIRSNLRFLQDLTGHRKKCYLLGQGKNYTFFNEFNQREKLFEEIIPLAHPRYIVQYKSKMMNDYLKVYTEALGH